MLANPLKTVTLATTLLVGTTASGLAQDTVVSGYEGWFVRGELGANVLATDRGYWHGPGGAGDPRITFSLNRPVSVTGGIGLGYDWGNGVRVDGSAGFVSSTQVDGTYLTAVGGNPSPAGDHATDIHGAVSAFALMANLYVEPLTLSGSESAIQPFLTGGVGIARVSMGEWTRNNAASAQTTRSWSGSDQINLAWSAGGGVSFALADLIGGNGTLDFTYRYTDLGQASGGGVPVAPPPNNSPTEPYNFRMASHALTVGLRLPIGN